MPTSSAKCGRSVTFLLRQPRQTQGFRELLRADGEAEALTLVWIPPGRFWMGSLETEPERRDSEGPQHLVQLQGFLMSQTPITQAQWREVAQWRLYKDARARSCPSCQHTDSRVLEKRAADGGRSVRRRHECLNCDFRFTTYEQQLDPDPSHFKGDDRPVEQVSWLDAMEFCNRLSQRTGRTYTLPSEAQWEYACRAVTTTPFCFGDTINPELVNYLGDLAYTDGPQGVNREQTTPVGMFPANAWGLHDMRGNVWEWCQDEWHESYAGVPTDGRAWVDPAEREKSKESVKTRLLRGGSWFNYPRACRSAFRGHYRPDCAFSSVGFRVV